VIGQAEDRQLREVVERAVQLGIARGTVRARLRKYARSSSEGKDRNERR